MSIGVNNYASSYTAASYPKSPAVKEKPEAEQTADATIVQKPETFKPDMDKINAMKAESKNNLGAFKQMVYSMIKSQGGYASDALKSVLNIDEATQLSAQEAIADDGYWGVEQTAQRILDFAKALSGGDPSAISDLKDAVLKGFEAAEKAFGGNLPDISYQTKQRIMDGFDEWEKSGVTDVS